MIDWAVPHQDTLRQIIFPLQCPDWQVHSPAAGSAADGRWHACNGSTDLAADFLAALLDEVDWLHAT